MNPPQSAPTSPGRSFNQTILSSDPSVNVHDTTLPEAFKDQMMSEWSRETVIAVAQESSKTVSVNGSRSGTNATGPRNFLAVNGNFNSGGTNSGTQSPHGDHPPAHRSRPASTAYGLVGGLGSLKKTRKTNGNSPSESSKASVTRVDQLKRVLSGHQNILPATARSDASSESMVSYDFAASEVSFNPSGQQNIAPHSRSASLRDRSRSKSADRDERARPLTSHPVLGTSVPNVPDEDLDAVPPVPPLPASMTGDSIDVRKSRSIKRSGTKKSTQGASWGQGGQVVDLESLLKGIDTSGGQNGYVITPPY